MPLHAVALNCSLKPTPAPSSPDKLHEMLAESRAVGVACSVPIRVVDRDIKAGVSSDEGPGDDWPVLWQLILDRDIVVLGTPIWLGQPSSVTKRVLERMDAFLGETDDQGRMVSNGTVRSSPWSATKTAPTRSAPSCSKPLNDVGCTLAAGAVTYWVGEAMGGVDDKNRAPTAEKTQAATRRAARTPRTSPRSSPTSLTPRGGRPRPARGRLAVIPRDVLQGP